MTFDECLSQLRNADKVPKAALTAGMAHAEALAPMVYEIAGKLAEGVYLMPAENELLFNGLHVLAAVRHPGLLDCLLELIQQPEADLGRLFPGYESTGLARLFLSVWDRTPQELMHLIEDDDLSDEVTWALFDVLARLTFEGRIAKSETVAFLEAAERDGLFDAGDNRWWGWEDAVVRLGLLDMIPALRRMWEKDAGGGFNQADRDEALAELRAAAEAAPGDASMFDEDSIRPISDPVEAMGWIERREEVMARWNAEHDDTLPPDHDVARQQRLTQDEKFWLAGLLDSRQTPATAMSFEQLDGFLTALVIGPATVPPSEYLSYIWGPDGGDTPIWDSTEQAEHTIGLIMKQWNAIAARRAADAPHRPEIERFGALRPGQDWARGFMDGVALRTRDWEPVFASKNPLQLLLLISALADNLEPDASELSPENREQLLRALPEALRRISIFWRSAAFDFGWNMPLRSQKVGRNQPCPCGSGKKYKKCCGSATSLH